ncbi:MAG: hypothetical protein AAF702_03270 [Chloroflexota bacterium]
MIITTSDLEWQVCDEKQDGNVGEEKYLEIEEKLSPRRLERLQRHIYEMVLAVFLIYGVIGFWGWQQSQQRMAKMEERLSALTQVVMAQKTQALGNIQSDGNDKQLELQVLETVYFIFIFSPEDKESINTVARNIDKRFVNYLRDPRFPTVENHEKLTIYIKSKNLKPPMDSQINITISWSEYDAVNAVRGIPKNDWLEQRISIELFKQRLNIQPLPNP